MKNNLLEHIILYVIVASVALIIATLARMSATAMGFDSFTAFMVFVIVLAIQVVVYLSIHVLLQGLMLPWIEKWLSKIPYFKKRMKEREVPAIEQKEEIAAIPEPVPLKDIQNKQRQNIAKEQNEKQNVALEYTRNCFALYVSDEHVDVLCRNVQVYIDKLNENELRPVKVKDLTALDLRHFGWNIWDFYKPRNQMDMAHFLKVVFPEPFKDATEDSIKSHLKDDELKGVIKIEEKLLVSQISE